MSTGAPAIEITHFEPPIKGAQITELRCNGWAVRIAGAAVTVPSQDLGGKAVEDLAYCLSKAYALANVHIPPQPSTLRPEAIRALTATLAQAARIAKAHWSPRSCDIYRCTRAAWEHDGMRVPYAALIRSLRAALPARTTLIEYNDYAHRNLICQLYAHAIAALEGTSQRGVA